MPPNESRAGLMEVRVRRGVERGGENKSVGIALAITSGL